MANILHIKFPCQYLMCATMMRFQEYYESPYFKGKYFTHEEYMDWYAKENGNHMSYFEDWDGFNFPTSILVKFMTGPKYNMFRPIHKKEETFLNIIRERKDDLPAYVIATHAEDKNVQTTFNHELVHALFYRFKDYRETVQKIIASFPLSQEYQVFRINGYHDDVFADEFNAYMVTGLPTWFRQRACVKRLQPQLQIVFRNFFGDIEADVLDKLVETVEWK